MLVLNRPDGEGVLLTLPDGGEVRMFVERAGNRRNKVFIDAPQSVSISRIDKTGTPVGGKTPCQSTKDITATFQG